MSFSLVFASFLTLILLLKSIPTTFDDIFVTRAGNQHGQSAACKAVKWRVLDQTIAEACDRFAGTPPHRMEAMIQEAVTATRLSRCCIFRSESGRPTAPAAR
jgi:hypothetical protein